jgi:hypothetical protein
VGIERVDIGMVSAGDALVAFYASALGLDRLEPLEFPFCTLHRLRCGSVLLKVMVPKERPAASAPAEHPWDVAGLRYLTMWVDDLDGTIGTWTAAGGTVRTPPMALRPGVRLAVLADPEDNVLEVMEDRS